MTDSQMLALIADALDGSRHLTYHRTDPDKARCQLAALMVLRGLLLLTQDELLNYYDSDSQRADKRLEVAITETKRCMERDAEERAMQR